MHLFKDQIHFLGHDINKNTIRPITRSLEFSSKFSDEIKVKKQLQRFLGCLNYIHDFFKDLGIIFKHIKQKIPTLLCLNLPHPNAKIIVETDASDIRFGGEMSSSSSSSKIDNKKPISQKRVPFPSRPNRFPPLESKLVTYNISSINTVSPFIKSPSLSPLGTQKTILSTKTPCIINPNIERIQILEDSHISKLNQGFHILTGHLFGHGQTFYSDPYKTREYYQTIFQQSSSICFTHRSNSSERTIDSSKAQILKVISPQDWSLNPHSEKILVGYPAYPNYSYYDYQEA
uniref:Reverse transcriptase/retrotransposon-derived protein RNase H-like domain-containing protein n=1 Tax=Lactuca sativa TaxID=4236 RepID=A0A9R1VQE0_LACSA|nr:hypothetical protein LSAT_V11C400171540 [Lactuca sativa]